MGRADVELPVPVTRSRRELRERFIVEKLTWNDGVVSSICKRLSVSEERGGGADSLAGDPARCTQGDNSRLVAAVTGIRFGDAKPAINQPREARFDHASLGRVGVEIRGNSTYTATIRPDGTLFGDGQGVDIGNGGEIASWKRQGIGQFVGPGTVRYRGAIYYDERRDATIGAERARRTLEESQDAPHMSTLRR